MLAAIDERRFDDYQHLLVDRAEEARMRREALACCVACHNPLLATEDAFQFCPYERARQHERISAMVNRAPPALARSGERQRRSRARSVRRARRHSTMTGACGRG